LIGPINVGRFNFATTRGQAQRERRTSVLHQVLARVAAKVGEWRRRSRDRSALAAMSDRSLRDIGITRYDAAYEASEPFWRA